MEDLHSEELDVLLNKQLEQERVKSQIKFAESGCKRFAYYDIPNHRGIFRYHPFYNNRAAVLEHVRKHPETSSHVRFSETRRSLVEIFQPYIVFKMFDQDGIEVKNWENDMKSIIQGFNHPYKEELDIVQRIKERYEERQILAIDKSACLCHRITNSGSASVSNESQKDKDEISLCNKDASKLLANTESFSSCRTLTRVKKSDSLRGLNLVFNSKDNEYICRDCGDVVMSGAWKSEKQAFERKVQTKKESSLYDPRHNWKDQLSRKQSRENVTFPPNMLENIALAFIKDKLDFRYCHKKLLRKYLRELGYDKYLNNIARIQYEFTGYRPQQFTPEQDLLYVLHFEQFQKVYPLVKDKNRSSLLNTNVLGYKICEMFDWQDHIKFFPLIGDPDILKPQLEVWYRACDILNWNKIETKI